MRFSLVACLVVALAVALGAQARPQAPAARVIDRTVVCAAALNGGIREIQIRTQSGAVKRGSRWDKPALAMVTTGNTGSAANALYDAVAWAVAGVPTGEAMLIQTMVDYPYPVNAWGTLAMSNRCKVSRARLALSPSGLRGAPVGPLGETYDCTTSRSFLVRIRGLLTADSTLSTRRGNLATTTPLREAQVVVATATGKRLVYASVAASGKARLFTAPSCIPD